jgi:integrase
MEDAGTEGILVPPYNGITWWADAWGRALSEAAKRIGWTWVPHYLRHHYGSFSIADREDGGMGMHYTKVQKSMGHASPEITLRVYAHSVEGETEGWIS